MEIGAEGVWPDGESRAYELRLGPVGGGREFPL